jgi:alpha-glucosidase
MQPFSAGRFERAARNWYAALPEGGWAALALSNHDQPRAAFRFRSRLPGRAGKDETRARAKVAAAMLLLLRGTPFIYYGEEIGMGCRRLPRKALRDPLGIHTWPLGFIGRDPERTPMQWDGSEGAGFSPPGTGTKAAAAPWLPLNPEYPVINVEAQAGDPASTLSFYKRILGLRKAHRALKEGDIRFLRAPKGLMAFERSYRSSDAGVSQETILVILNFTRWDRSYFLESPGRILLAEGKSRQGGFPEGASAEPGTISLGPYGVAALSLAPGLGPGKAMANSI